MITIMVLEILHAIQPFITFLVKYGLPAIETARNVVSSQAFTSAGLQVVLEKLGGKSVDIVLSPKRVKKIFEVSKEVVLIVFGSEILEEFTKKIKEKRLKKEEEAISFLIEFLDKKEDIDRNKKRDYSIRLIKELIKKNLLSDKTFSYILIYYLQTQFTREEEKLEEVLEKVDQLIGSNSYSFYRFSRIFLSPEIYKKRSDVKESRH